MDLTGFISLVNSYSLIGYVAMFLVAVVEVMIFIGAVFPGQNIIIASGFIAQQGGFNPITLMWVVFTGTILGNLFTYWLGWRYGDAFLLKYGKHFRFEQKYLDIAKHYMRDHVGKTLLIGRFNPLIRSFIPFVAATTDVRLPTFLFYTVLGSAIWTVAFVTLGYVLGKSYEIAFGYMGFVAIISFVIVGLIFYWFLKKNYGKLAAGF